MDEFDQIFTTSEFTQKIGAQDQILNKVIFLKNCAVQAVQSHIYVKIAF